MFNVDVFTGDKLRHVVSQKKTVSFRDQFAWMQESLVYPVRKLLLLTGQKWTGKTTLMQQSIHSLSQEVFAQTVYLALSMEQDIHFRDIRTLCWDLFEKGYRFFFINEATAAMSFSAQTKELADTLCSYGCHIYVTGSDSFAMELAKNHLLGRYEEVRTTKIPFYEWCRLFPARNTLADYIQSRGLLVQTDDNDYVKRYIAENIQNSILRNNHTVSDEKIDRQLRSNAFCNHVEQIVQTISYDKNDTVDKKIIKYLLKMDIFSKANIYTVPGINTRAFEQDEYIISSQPRPNALKEIVLSDILDVLPNKCEAGTLIFKNIGVKFDIVIFNFMKMSVSLVDVVDDYTISLDRLQKFLNEDLLQKIEKIFFVKIVNRMILYRGDSQFTKVSCTNIESFLSKRENLMAMVMLNV